MNIVFFMQDTGAVFGAERATLDLAVGLRSAGESVQFLLIQEKRRGADSAFRERIRQEGFPLELFPVHGRFSWPLVMELRRRFRDAGAPVMHVIGYKANVHAWLARIRPRVSTVHGWLFRRDWKEKFFAVLELFCLRHCDRVICLSHFYQDFLLRRGVRPERLQLIPSGLREVPLRVEKPAAASGKGMTFGMMGRFSEEKAHGVFLRAASVASREEPGIRFKIAGAGPLEPELKTLAKTLGLDAVLTFTGYERVEDYFPSIDVYVICSTIENLPYSILEAMAYAKPVIGTRVGGIPDLVGNGENGLLVDSGSEKDLAVAMVELSRDPIRASQITSRTGAGETMKKTFLWLTMLAIAGFVVGCELDNNKGRNLNFENASRHNVNVIPRTTEWGSFSLAPGETKKLEDIENPDFTWQPLSQVDVGSSSTDRNVIFVDRAPIYDPTEPIIIIQESE